MSNILTNNINPRSGNTINIGGVNTKVSIAGTLTYEDVTSVDSVGVVTAQSGVVVSGGGFNVTGVSTFNDNIRVSAGQSVGIGTTRPAADLDVAGNIEMNGSELGGFLTGDIPHDAIRTYHMGNDMGLKIRGGLMMITAHANMSSGQYGLYPQPIGTGLVYIDCGGSVATPIVLTEPQTGLLGSTSSSTTITDFTDNRVTIVALADQIRIVNRISGSRAFKLTFL